MTALGLSEKGHGTHPEGGRWYRPSKVTVWRPPLPWKERQLRGVDVWQAGTLDQADRIAAAVGSLDSVRLDQLLRAERGQFGLIIESEKHVVAAADRVTGFQIFLRRTVGKIEVSADSSVWLTHEMRSDFDEDQAKLFLMAGYCLGRETLLKSVVRLLPGEIAIISKKTGVIEWLRYYRFEPSFDGQGDEPIWRKRLDETLDAAVERFLDRSAGRRIWLGLSAGYDSRVLLGKLLQHGARDLQTFSYGTPGNMESRVARDLAASVGVPWCFVATNGWANRRDYWRGDCARYLMRGGGVHTIAAVTEYFALQKLMDKRQLSADDVVTNGQTGDFLTGGHIPKSTELSYRAIDRYILEKHLSLFTDTRDALGVKGTDSLMAAWRKANLSSRRLDEAVAPVSAYQTFEWQERQSRLVVNQHRAHDFLGLTWRTPLWDADLMDLFEKVPLDLQHHQKLYLQYLKSWNYRNLFDQMRLPYDPWPRGGALIKGFARLAGLVRGAPAKAAAYERLAYFGEYHYLYRLTGRRAFLAFEKVARSPASLFALDHLARVHRAFGLEPTSPHELRFDKLMAKHLARVPAPASVA